MAGRNTLKISFDAFAEYAEKIEKLGGDLKAVVTDALQQAAETVGADTLEAVAPGNLPAQGKYSRGNTEASVVTESQVRVEWSGNVASVGLGFDKSKPGAGGFLITGTPRMRPDYKLQAIFGRKTYQRQIMEDIGEIFADALEDLGG